MNIEFAIASWTAFLLASAADGRWCPWRCCLRLDSVPDRHFAPLTWRLQVGHAVEPISCSLDFSLDFSIDSGIGALAWHRHG